MNDMPTNIAAYGMSAGEIVIAVLTTISLVLGIIKVWISSQTEFAKVQTEIISIKEKQSKTDNDLKQHKEEDNLRYEQMRKENREDHGKLFDKIDSLRK